MTGRFRPTAALLALLVLVLATPMLHARTIYKGKFNSVRLIAAKKKLTGGEALTQPHELPEAKLHNMLASLRFAKNSILFKDKEDQRLFDKKGLNLLSPYLVQAFREVSPEQVVAFTYIKKAPQLRVIRNDRLIRGKMFIRDGELYIYFTKLYAKIFGDYQRAGNERKMDKARDVRVSLESKPGQRTIDTRFIALRIDHDYLSDLKRQLAEDERLKAEKKKQKKAAETVSGVPLPDVARDGSEDDPSAIDTSGASDGDVVVRLKTLKELRAKKLISNREYEAKRRKILGEL